MSETFYGKKAMARRYDASERTIDRASRDGRLPPPDFYLGRLPRWGERKLDAHDREAARKRLAK